MDEAKVYRRDTQEITWDLIDDSGQRFDVTGYTAKLSAKRNIDDADADRVFDVDVTLDVENSRAKVTLTPTELAEYGRLIAELRLIKAGAQLTVHQFELDVQKDVQ